MAAKAELHVDLAEDGLEGQWIELVNLALKRPKEVKRLRELPSTPAELAALPQEEAVAAAREYVAFAVTGWNLLAEDGTALPPPSSPTLDVDEIPTGVTARIKAELGAQMEDLQNLKARSRRA